MKRVIGYMAALCLLAILVITVGCGGVTSSGALAYISNSNGTGFTVFKVNTDGTLERASISPQNTPVAPKLLRFTPNGKWAYFLSADGQNIYAYTRSGNGTLPTLIDKYPVNGASSMVISTNSTFLYVALPNSQTGQLLIYSIDPSTGILNQVNSAPNVGYRITQLEIAPGGGTLYGLSPSQTQVVTWALNASSGVATFGGTFPVGSTPSYMILSANGSYMYVLDHTDVGTNTVGIAGSPNIYAFNVSGSTLTAMAGSPFHENANAITGIVPTNPVAGATSNDTRFLFIANQGTENISVFRIITSSGTSGTAGQPTEVLGSTTTVNSIATSSASPFDCGSGCVTPSFLAVDSANNALYLIDSGDPAANPVVPSKIFQYAINQNTGKLRALKTPYVSPESSTSNPSWITIR
jgi:6-phosphogluconolactonase (cycloisomerase 2 family)